MSLVIIRYHKQWTMDNGGGWFFESVEEFFRGPVFGINGLKFGQVFLGC